MSLDVDTSELRCSEVLEESLSLADLDSNVIVRSLNQMLATTLADEVEALAKSSVRIRLIRVIRTVECQLGGEELQADIWFDSAVISATVGTR